MAFAIVIALYAAAATLAFRLRRHPASLAIAAIAWASLPFYNAWILAGCPGDCSIRVDLVLVVPLAAIATLPALSFAWGRWARRN